MKLVFFGTPDYAVHIAEALRKQYNRGAIKGLVAVVTQPPKPAGRKKKLTHSAIDNWAYKLGVQVVYKFEDIPKADLGIVASYGRIIPKNIIESFEKGVLNVHFSDLPEFRGASPLEATILSGKEKAVVSVIKMDEKLDHGPVVSRFEEKIRDDDTTESLRKRLFERSAGFLLELIPNYVEGKIQPKEQKHAEATYTRTLTKQDGFISPKILSAALEGKTIEKKWKIRFMGEQEMEASPERVERFIRAMWSWPGAWTTLRLKNSEEQTRRLRIIKAHMEEEKLMLDEVQLEGKNPVSWKQFEEGYPEAKFEES